MHMQSHYCTSHYNALYQSLLNEKQRLADAKTEQDKTFRLHNISMIEKELKQEEIFLACKGISVYSDLTDNEMTDDDILSELLD